MKKWLLVGLAGVTLGSLPAFCDVSAPKGFDPSKVSGNYTCTDDQKEVFEVKTDLAALTLEANGIYYGHSGYFKTPIAVEIWTRGLRLNSVVAAMSFVADDNILFLVGDRVYHCKKH